MSIYFTALLPQVHERTVSCHNSWRLQRPIREPARKSTTSSNSLPSATAGEKNTNEQDPKNLHRRKRSQFTNCAELSPRVTQKCRIIISINTPTFCTILHQTSTASSSPSSISISILPMFPRRIRRDSLHRHQRRLLSNIRL